MQAFREEWSLVVATLIRVTGDWDLAEECAQDAFTLAVRTWPRDGIPAKPGPGSPPPPATEPSTGSAATPSARASSGRPRA